MFEKEKLTPAQTVVREVCRVKKNERVLIVTNPSMAAIAQSLYTALLEEGAVPVLIYQSVKTLLDTASPEVIAALKTEPDVFFSISEQKLGKDSEAIAKPYVSESGEKFDHIFNFLIGGKKTMRAVWTPGLTENMFERTVCIDYKLLSETCKKLCKRYEGVKTVRVTSPGGTNVEVPVWGRKPMSDNGDFSEPGSGGNIPAGEVFISPVVGSGNEGTQGKIVFDGSMSFSDGTSLLKTPIAIEVENGFITSVTGGDEAKRLLKSITDAEKTAVQMEKDGKLPEGQGAVYKRNARNIGELGIGLNPAASIGGNMLEDEKAFRTCHFAVGMNYDGDAQCLIHLDGVVRDPTITFVYEDNSEFVVLKNGDLQGL
ncbi:peptidase M17 [Treponema parvum]|uniref:Peptidase M17 n=1 Tax=Treponema parvum TaxID=138851 RepID=A0A975F5K1_9SPIR|nr:peptidase M17 [Treponema parvum]QTQ14792.1 peptidase M17 [Treponema parvum]